MSVAAAQRIASKLCGGYPNVCETHAKETIEILELIPELLYDPEVIEAAARVQSPNLDHIHPAFRTLVMSVALTHLTGAARHISEVVLP